MHEHKDLRIAMVGLGFQVCAGTQDHLSGLTSEERFFATASSEEIRVYAAQWTLADIEAKAKELADKAKSHANQIMTNSWIFKGFVVGVTAACAALTAALGLHIRFPKSKISKIALIIGVLSSAVSAVLGAASAIKRHNAKADYIKTRVPQLINLREIIKQVKARNDAISVAALTGHPSLADDARRAYKHLSNISEYDNDPRTT